MHEKENITQNSCPTVGSQIATVCLPVTVKPFAVTGPAKVECFGRPMIDENEKNCCGKPGGSCHFTISQRIKIDIPVEFGATVKIGETFVECEHAKVECEDAQPAYPCTYNN